MINYRTAVPTDVIDLIGLVEEYADEAGFAHDLPSVKQYINMQLGKVPAIVAVDNDEVVGVMTFIVMPQPFKLDEKIGRKIACFVKKTHRDLGIGEEMIKHCEDGAKSLGATTFYLSSPTAPSDKYQAFETEYKKELI